MSEQEPKKKEEYPNELEHQEQEEKEKPRKDYSKSGVIQRALQASAQSNSNNGDDYEDRQIVINLTDTENKKIAELCDFLGLSLENCLNIAIKYSLSYASLKNLTIDQLNGYPKSLGNIAHDIELNMKTEIALEEADSMSKVSECAVLGIELMHMKLIESNKIG
jgi:hypothetical protein